jgi:hypothetical protein
MEYVMAVRQLVPQFVYGIGDNLIQLPPRPIVAKRDPASNDLAQIGTFWVNTVSGVIFACTQISSGSATWSSSPAGGATVLADLTITGVGGLDVQNAASTTTISSSTINFDNAAGTTTFSGDVDIQGVLTFTGDLDLTSAALIDLTSTLDAAPSIYLHANGGTSEQIRIHSDQGTSVNSVELDSDVGGITLVSGLASADAINLSATAGGVDVDGILQINIASSQAAADALRLVASEAAGGIDVDAGTGGIAIDSTGAVSIDAAAASNMSVSGAGIDLTLASAAGRVIVNGEEAADNAITLLSAAGGLDADVALQLALTSSEAAADAIVIEASDAAGGVQVKAGSAGILIGNEADTAVIDIGDVVPTSARTITISGGAVATAIADTLDLGPDGATTDAGASKVVNVNTGALDTATLTTNIGSGAVTSGTHTVNIQSGNAAAGTVATNVSTGTGTKTVNLGNADGLTTFNVDAITLINDSINVNTSINTGTSTGVVALGNALAGAITLDSAAGISLDGGAASNFSVAGAGIDLTFASAAGRVVVNGEEAAADAITLVSAAGGIDWNSALQSNIDSSQAAADAIRLTASDAAGGIDVDAGTGGIAINSTGAVSIQGAAASDFSVSGAGVDVSIVSAAGRAVVNGEEAADDAVRLVSAAGGIDMDAALSITITSSEDTADSIVIESSAGGIDILASGAEAGQDIDITATGSSVNITATEAAADAIVLNSSNAAGGIDLLTGGGEITISSSGNVTMAPSTATVASPTATATINARVFKATFTGFTTAAGATQSYTITNSAFGVGDGVFLTVANAGSNDCQLTVQRVNVETAGSIVVTVKNNGAAAQNGNTVITGWIVD